MKAIVANLLFGSILGCLSCANLASASTPPAVKPLAQKSIAPVLSAKLISPAKLPGVPQIIDVIDRILTAEQPDTYDLNFEKNVKITLQKELSADSNLNLEERQNLTLEKLPYTHRAKQADLVLGFQNTFWSSQKKHKYWGLTTIEHWGDSNPSQKSKLKKRSKLNYLDSAPVLPTGTATLTLSGGGKENLANKTKTNQINHISPEFQEFRAGITYHRGLADQVTVGVGFVYEDLLVGFTQLTYKSDFLPLQTTVSLLAKESGVDVHSHVRLEPARNIVLNYYNDKEKHRLDAGWDIIPGLTLMAKSNSQDKSFSTGVKVAIHSDLISLSADAVLDNENNLQWKVQSRIGRLNFAYSSDPKKSVADLSLEFLDSDTYGIQCSAFVKHQTKLVKKDEEEFVNWGTRINSATKVGKNKSLWNVELGYGSGSHGKGLIVNSSVALQPDMFLNLSYEEVSRKSDETEIKLLLSSK